MKKCHSGKLQLPDFQRSWVWDIDRITSLIASVSKGFPVGALMALESGGAVTFHPRLIEGAPVGKSIDPQELLLDGQQRITSLYQATSRDAVVNTTTIRGKALKRWFYFDMVKALDSSIPREEAIVAVPEDKLMKSNFGHIVDLDLSKPAHEFANLHFPLNQVFDVMDWQLAFYDYWRGKEESDEMGILLKAFSEEIIKNFTEFDIPVITLDKETTKEAVCIVFEKVNTGGKALDAFELITAIYAADGHQLRNDWYGTESEDGIHQRLKVAFKPAGSTVGILAGVEPTDFMQVISLFHTRDLRRAAESAGKLGKELPQVTATRQALLNLPLEAYKQYKDLAEEGFMQAAKFLHRLHIFRIYDLPYQSQVVPLAAILADLGNAWENATTRSRIVKWYWNGVFGELYGSSTETRIAKDFMEVGPWLQSGSAEPATILDSQFRADRLRSMRMRLSAAYKGVNALLMEEDAKDWRTGQEFDHTVFFGESVDIHHVFPQKWCKASGYDKKVFDSIINKTPLSKRTNILIGGDAPSIYLSRLEKGSDKDPAIDSATLDSFVSSHLIDHRLLRSDSFEKFMDDRQQRLVRLIEKATGKAVSQAQGFEEDEDGDLDEETEAID